MTGHWSFLADRDLALDPAQSQGLGMDLLALSLLQAKGSNCRKEETSRQRAQSLYLSPWTSAMPITRIS